MVVALVALTVVEGRVLLPLPLVLPLVVLAEGPEGVPASPPTPRGGREGTTKAPLLVMLPIAGAAEEPIHKGGGVVWVWRVVWRVVWWCGVGGGVVWVWGWCGVVVWGGMVKGGYDKE